MTKEEALRKIDELKQHVEELDDKWPKDAYGYNGLAGVVVQNKRGATGTIVYVSNKGYYLMDKDFYVWTHQELGKWTNEVKGKLTALGFTPAKDQPNVK